MRYMIIIYFPGRAEDFRPRCPLRTVQDSFVHIQ